MLSSLRNFVQTHIGTSSDYEGASTAKKAAMVGGWAALTTGVGAAIGASRQAQDVVTYTQEPIFETYRVQTGTSWNSHCTIPMQAGDMTIYQPGCYWEDPVYTTYRTDRVIGHEQVAHHSVGFPNTVVQGALLGLGVGVVTGVAGLVVAEMLKR